MEKKRACIAKHTRGFYGQCSSGPGQIFGQDINECEVFGASKLCPGGACINQLSKFACTCEQDGYYWENGNCVNFDECSLKGTYCVGGKCIDTDGSYTCECPEGQEENNGICQTPDHMMAIVENQVQVTDFDEPSSCFITESCDDKYKLHTQMSHKECCCSQGLSWQTQSQCFNCTGQSDLLDRLCVTDDYSSSDQSELEDFTDGDSFELDGDDIYDIGVFDSNDQSESENYAPTYDNLESEYDSSSMIPDQPRKRPINIGREAPISLRVQEKIPISNRAFACGLPGGCGRGQCVQSRRGVSCHCNKGWKKNRQGKCAVRQH